MRLPYLQWDVRESEEDHDHLWCTHKEKGEKTTTKKYIKTANGAAEVAEASATTIKKDVQTATTGDHSK